MSLTPTLSLPPLPRSITITTLPISSVVTSPDLDPINDLLNAAYQIMGHPNPLAGILEGDLYTGSRISYRTQLVDELGVDNVIAICRDTSTLTDPGKIVAVAALKPFKQKTVYAFKRDAGTMSHDLLLEELEYAKTENWEVSTCATVDDTRYRGVGLISRCVDILVGQIEQRRKERGETRPLKLWVTALGGTANPGYWRKRGYVDVGPIDAAPVGLWSAKRDFEIQTLAKVVD